MSAHAAILNAAADAHASDPQSQLAAARPTSKPSKRVTCSECGVVESIREIARPEVVGRQDNDVKLAPRVSGAAIVARTIAGKSYEITVRFRDGSTTVFNEAHERGEWAVG